MIQDKDAKVTECQVTFLLPCLNEEQTIAQVIREAREHLNSLDLEFEILVVDNGSYDNSVECALREGARVVTESRQGYGNALRKGISKSKGDFILFADADLSYDLSSIGLIINHLKSGSDLVIGNRFKGGIENGAMPWLHKYVGNPILSLLGRRIYSISIGDFHCGLRGFRKKALAKIKFTSPGMEFASEMIVKSALNGLRVNEVPTALRKDGRNRKSHLRTWRDGWRHLIFLLVHAPSRILLIPFWLGSIVFTILLMLYVTENVPPNYDDAIRLILPGILSASASLFWFATVIAGVAETMGLGKSSTFFKCISHKLNLNRVLTVSGISSLLIAVFALFFATLFGDELAYSIYLGLVAFTTLLSSIYGAFITHLIRIQIENNEDN